MAPEQIVAQMQQLTQQAADMDRDMKSLEDAACEFERKAKEARARRFELKKEREQVTQTLQLARDGHVVETAKSAVLKARDDAERVARQAAEAAEAAAKEQTERLAKIAALDQEYALKLRQLEARTKQLDERDAARDKLLEARLKELEARAKTA